jgi:hypothetical protein
MSILELYIAIGILIAGFVLFSISLNKDIVKEVEFTTKVELTFYVYFKVSNYYYFSMAYYSL